MIFANFSVHRCDHVHYATVGRFSREILECLMRKARTIALTTGAGVLTAAFVAAMTTSAPAALAAHTTPTAPVIRVSPGIIQLPQAKTLSTPWTTALCESQLSIACYGPDQIRAAYNVAPLYKHGITGKGETIIIVDSFGSPT